MKEGLDGVTMLSLGIGMGAPVLLAASAGRLPLGMVAALGALITGNARTGRTYAEHLKSLGEVRAAATAAAVAASVVAGQSWLTDVGMIALACAAALVGGYSRSLAFGTGRFIVFFVMTLGVMELGQNRVGVLMLMVAGALWTSVLALALGGLFRAMGWITIAEPEPGSSATAVQKFRRWKNTLQSFAGWQYALRLAFCLGVASILRWDWPDHHFRWIALTVAILSHRQLEALPIKVTQRAIGAAVGVGATGLLISETPSGWALACAVAVLAGIGPWLRARNYVAYTASMTPLIILLLDAGRPVGPGILADRLIATLIGATLVIAANMLASRLADRL
jgi:hypothetical protein